LSDAPEKSKRGRPKKVNTAKRERKPGKGHKPRTDTRKAVAKEANISERKIRAVQEIKKAAPELEEKVQSGQVSILEARRLAALPAPSRAAAVKAIEAGENVRAAVREAKKEDYNATIAAAKPKHLEGTYRIIYADPPWKYFGLNQADEYGHAERHRAYRQVRFSENDKRGFSESQKSSHGPIWTSTTRPCSK
jgi:16S rRNA G966 N2-methylase RsmD